ncbi:hypothetical protein ACYULU_12555 [Breznakiellaceae bacterium SP9]
MSDRRPKSVSLTAERRKKLCEKLREMRQRMIDNGMKLHTSNEILDAFHEERAGGESFKCLWG